MEQQWRVKIVDHFYFSEQLKHCPMLLNQGDWRQGLSQQVPTSPLWIHKDHEYWGILMMRTMMLMILLMMMLMVILSTWWASLCWSKSRQVHLFTRVVAFPAKRSSLDLLQISTVYCPNWKSCIMNIRYESIVMGNLLVLTIWAIGYRLRLWICVFFWISLVFRFLFAGEGEKYGKIIIIIIHFDLITLTWHVFNILATWLFTRWEFSNNSSTTSIWTSWTRWRREG